MEDGPRGRRRPDDAAAESGGDVNGDSEPELVVAGSDGTVSVVDPDGGAPLATYKRNVPVDTHAIREDTDGDAAEEMFVVYADGSGRRSRRHCITDQRSSPSGEQSEVFWSRPANDVQAVSRGRT